MMKNRKLYKCLTYLIIVTFLPNLVFSQSSINIKTEALIFSLDMVRDIFSNNCEEFKKKFDLEIYALEDEIIPLSDFEDEICESLEDGIVDTSKSFQDYLRDYNPHVLTPEEFLKKYELEFPEFYDPQKEDFFFIVGELRDKNQDDYMWDELEVILVRKLKTRWVIKGGY